MKVRIHFKTPDAVFNAIRDMSYDEDERATFTWDIISDENAAKHIKERLAQWIRYGELVTLVYDSKYDTLVVEKLNE
jgi:hypothetical protein